MSIDVSGLQRELERQALDAMDRLEELFTDRVHSRMSRRTGFLYDSLEASDPVLAGDSVTAHVAVTADYAQYQDEGTGIYGPDGAPIVADEVTAGWVTSRGTVVHRFVFDWPAAGGIVFARVIQGAPGTHFWSEAIDAWPEIVAQVASGG